MHALLWIDNTMVVFYITILQATLRWAKKLWKWVDPLLALRAAYLLAWHRQGMCCLTASLYPAIWKSTCCCYWQALLPISPRLSEMTTHLEIMDFLGWFQHTEMLGKGLIHCRRRTYAHKWFFSPNAVKFQMLSFCNLPYESKEDAELKWLLLKAAFFQAIIMGRWIGELHVLLVIMQCLLFCTRSQTCHAVAKPNIHTKDINRIYH